MGLDNVTTFMTRPRPRGILTDADREYLRGERDLSRQAEFERRKALDERVYHGILDLYFLLEYFPDERREALVDRSKPEKLDLGPSIRGGIAFLWTFLPDISEEDVILDAIDASLKRRGWLGEADVTLNVEYTHRVRDSPRAFWGTQGGVLREPGGLVDRWKKEFEQRDSRISAPSREQVSEARTRFDELADKYLSGGSLSDDEVKELASFMSNESENRF